jgi:hypothetical protein
MQKATADIPRFESTSRADGFTWKPNRESLSLLVKAKELLDASPRPMTVRQLYYRLVAGLVIPNNFRSYQRLVGLLTNARKADVLDSSMFVDRARATTPPTGYDSLERYLDIVEGAYSRHPNDRQPDYIEVWTEKDALSAVIGDVVAPYGATLVVSKGYTSYTVIVEAAKRFKREISERGAGHCHLLYFGDFDPSGEDIFRVITSEIEALTGEGALNYWNVSGVAFHIEKIALTPELVDEHSLPPMPTKATDSRSEKFTAEHGDIAVELDALPPAVLEAVVEGAVSLYFDGTIRARILEEEAVEQDEIRRAIGEIKARRKKS